VATIDWCDRAAACLALAAEPAASLLVLCTLDAQGQILDREAIAAAVGEGNEAALLDLRSRAHRLNSLGFAPPAASRGPTIGTLDELAPGWRVGAIGRLLAGPWAGDAVAALGRLSGDCGRWAVAILAGVPEAEQATTVVGATFPMVLARAGESLGAEGPRSWLTAREQAVLEQLTQGRSVREIAESMGRSPHTVHDHVKTLHKKLNATTRGELIARALGHLSPASAQVEGKPLVLPAPSGQPLPEAV
jgi:DNA-binding CsgD family transcriptional regulator